MKSLVFMDCGFGFESRVSCIETHVMFCCWPVTDTLDSVHPFEKKKENNQEVLIRAVLLAEREGECMCVCGCQNWQTNLSQATPHPPQ